MEPCRNKCLTGRGRRLCLQPHALQVHSFLPVAGEGIIQLPVLAACSKLLPHIMGSPLQDCNKIDIYKLLLAVVFYHSNKELPHHPSAALALTTFEVSAAI